MKSGSGFPSLSKRQSRNRYWSMPALSVTLRKRAGTMMSVSTSLCGKGTTRLVNLVNGSIGSFTPHLLKAGPPSRYALARDDTVKNTLLTVVDSHVINRLAGGGNSHHCGSKRLSIF